MNSRTSSVFTLFFSAFSLLAVCMPALAAERVILISVDGLRPDAVTTLGPDVAPNFYRLREEGTFTDNARTDYDITVTLPNHTCMVTSRRIEGAVGHNWVHNGTPEKTIHENKGTYVASMFDIAHDAGMMTSLFASKSKFSLFDMSYGNTHGGESEHGRDKLDCYFESATGGGDETTAQPAVDMLIQELGSQTYRLSMLHILDPDAVGHHSGWMGGPYFDAVKRSDAMIGQVLAFVESHPDYANKTTIIVTADHGGGEGGHGDNSKRENYTIPFYVWGEGVTPGADLYAINNESRVDPGKDRPDYSGPQPIRNGDAGNLALSLLGLPAIPDSMINSDQSLRVAEQQPASR